MNPDFPFLERDLNEKVGDYLIRVKINRITNSVFVITCGFATDVELYLSITDDNATKYFLREVQYRTNEQVIDLMIGFLSSIRNAIKAGCPPTVGDMIFYLDMDLRVIERKFNTEDNLTRILYEASPLIIENNGF